MNFEIIGAILLVVFGPVLVSAVASRIEKRYRAAHWNRRV